MWHVIFFALMVHKRNTFSCLIIMYFRFCKIHRNFYIIKYQLYVNKFLKTYFYMYYCFQKIQKEIQDLMLKTYIMQVSAKKTKNYIKSTHKTNIHYFGSTALINLFMKHDFWFIIHFKSRVTSFWYAYFKIQFKIFFYLLQRKCKIFRYPNYVL